MNTILLPTDFSSNAEHAALYAGMLAKRLDAHVVLLHTYPIPMSMPKGYQVTFDTETSVLQGKEEAENNLAIFAELFIEKTGVPKSQITKMVEYGYTADLILETAKLIKADLIVMGTKGTTKALDRWLGINAQHVMKESECPVWFVPQNASLDFPLMIMYAADFKEDEIAATQRVLEIAKPLQATCEVIHIHEFLELNVGHTVKKMVHDLEGAFENEEVTVKSLNRGDIVEGLEHYITTHQPDVLALAIHDKSFLSKIFDTSITQHFVKAAQLPMLIFKKSV